MSSHYFLEGANIHHYAFVEGAIILPCQLLGGQMSTHAIFHRGGRCPGGKCLAPILLPSAESFKKGCCQLQAKVCTRSTG